MEQIKIDLSFLTQEVQNVLNADQAKTELEIRNGELQVKRLNALSTLLGKQIDYLKLQQEQQRLDMQDRQISLNEMRGCFEMGDKLAHMTEKLQKNVGKVMLGLFPEQDKRVVKIMEAAKKLTEIQEK